MGTTSDTVKKDRSLLSTIVNERRLIFSLAKNDFRKKYAGSHFGTVWAFVQPVVTVLVYFLIFGIGFRSGSNMSVPFVLYLVCGIVPWFYCQEVMMSGTNVLFEYSYLVKKVVFEIRTLPSVKAVSAVLVHAFFTLVAIIIGMLYGYMPSVYIIQLVYYFFAMFVFLSAMIYLTSAICVFFRDMAQIVQIVLQIGIWSVPIMFDPANFSWGEKYGFIFKINPMSYIVTGYRDAIFAKRWFFERPLETLYFWAVTLLICFIAGHVFKKLRPHFADVL